MRHQRSFKNGEQDIKHGEENMGFCHYSHGDKKLVKHGLVLRIIRKSSTYAFNFVPLTVRCFTNDLFPHKSNAQRYFECSLKALKKRQHLYFSKKPPDLHSYCCRKRDFFLLYKMHIHCVCVWSILFSCSHTGSHAH